MGELGDSPPIDADDLLALLEGSEKPLRVIKAILLGDDLLQRDAFLSGEIDSPETVVLTADQAKNEAPLPDELQLHEEAPRKIASDATWEAYFQFAASVGKRSCKLLSDWVSYEVTLRNQLACARARSLKLEDDSYVIAESLENEDEDFAALINEWSAAMVKSPLAAQRVLDSARWDWLDKNDAYYSFTIDELGVYAARLMLTRRWFRLGEVEEKSKKIKV